MNRFKIWFFVLFFVVSLSGQSRQLQSLIHLYQNKSFTELQESLQVLPKQSIPQADVDFFLGVLTQDGEQAQKKYSSAFASASPVVRKLAAEKLQDYFYAIGYYVTATNYNKYMVEHASDVISEQDFGPAVQKVNIFYIQVGAFGLEENALQRVEFLKTQDVQSETVKRKVNALTLYCVWIPGDKDLDKTLDYAEKIKQKFDLEFQIMKK